MCDGVTVRKEGQRQSLQTERFCPHHVIHSQCVLVKCVGSVASLLPSSYRDHTSLLTGGRQNTK